jgi:hypothetical protein
MSNVNLALSPTVMSDALANASSVTDDYRQHLQDIVELKARAETEGDRRAVENNVSMLVWDTKSHVDECHQSLNDLLKQVAEHEPVVSSAKRLAEDAVSLSHNEFSGFRISTRNPFTRLPAEILSEIFRLLSDSELDIAKPPSDWKVAGCNLRLVCRSWNHVASTTPALWSNIYVRLGRPTYGARADAERGPLLDKIISMLLLRSRTYPLDVRLVIDCSLEPSASFNPQPFHTLWSSRTRWRTLLFKISSDVIPFVSDLTLDFDMPLLERAYLGSVGNRIFNRVAAAPRLISLINTGTSLYDPPRSVTHNTPYIETDNVSYLPIFPQAKLITIDADHFPRNEPIRRLPPSCTSLRLLSSFDSSLCRLVGRVEAPAIINLSIVSQRGRTLAFDTHFPGDVHLSAAILRFFERSGCRIQHLIIQDTSMPFEELCSLLKETSETLTRLTHESNYSSFVLRTKNENSLKLVRELCLSKLRSANITLKYKLQDAALDKSYMFTVLRWWLSKMKRGKLKYKVFFPFIPTEADRALFETLLEGHQLNLVEVIICKPDQVLLDDHSMYICSRKSV